MAVIHNGIIENFAALRSECERNGVEFVSETDTEVAAHLLAAAYAQTPRRAPAGWPRRCEGCARRLEGAFTLVAVLAARARHPGRRAPQQPAGGRRGRGRVLPRLRRRRVHRAHPGGARAGPGPGRRDHRTRGVTVTDFSGTPGRVDGFHVDWDAAAAEKGGYDWFMLKEIAEQPQAIADTLLGRLGTHGGLILDEVRLSDQELRDIDKIFVVACGTGYHAGLIAKYAIEHWTRIPVEVELASEFRYRDPVLDRSTLVIVISQSGETMDTLMALRHAKEQRARVLAICNANGSTIPRESDAVLYTHAGPEVAVASTKGFLTQVVACYLVGLFLAQVRGIKYEDEIAAIVADLRRAARGGGRGARGWSRSASSPGPSPTRTRSSSSAATSGTRWRWRGPQAQGAGVHPRRGLRRRRAQARAHRGDRRGHPGDRRRPVAAQPRVGARQGRLQHPGGPARGARTIVIAEEGDDEVLPYADHVIRVPRTPTLLAPGGHDRAAAGARLRDRRHPRSGRRPAQEPGEVRHRRVTAP